MSSYFEQLRQAGSALLDARGHGPALPAYWLALYDARLAYWQLYQHQRDIGPMPRPPVAPATARTLEKQRRRALGQAKARARRGGPLPDRQLAAHIFTELMTDRGRFKKNRYRLQDDIGRCRYLIRCFQTVFRTNSQCKF